MSVMRIDPTPYAVGVAVIAAAVMVYLIFSVAGVAHF